MESSIGGNDVNAQPERKVQEMHSCTPEPPLFVTVPHAARLLSMARSTLYRLCSEGKLPSRKIGGCVRIPYGELLRLVDPEPRKEE